MIPKPYKDVRYEWLSPSEESCDGKIRDDFGKSGWVDYPMLPETGKGGYEALELVFGMSVVRTTLEFSPEMLGQWLPLMTTHIEYTEPSFQAFTMRGLRGSVKEEFPPSHVAVSPGMDLFRHTERYCSTFTVDAGFSGEAHHVSLSRTVLNQLIGEAMGVYGLLPVCKHFSLLAIGTTAHVYPASELSTIARAMMGYSRACS